jgi:DnaA-homolog protein
MTDRHAEFEQLPLALRLAPSATFESYVANGNAVALAQVRAVACGTSRDAIWLAAERGAGKSHLLQAACAAATALGRRAIYVPLRHHDELDPGILEDLDTLDLVALDDLEAVAGNAAWEAALFGVLTPLSSAHPGVVLASAQVPARVDFALRDLASRAAGALVYRIEPLSDQGRIAALQRHAATRGLRLETPAAQFLLTRIARDMGTVSAWLDRLDTEALATQRQITIPLIRRLLERAAEPEGGASVGPRAGDPESGP